MPGTLTVACKLPHGLLLQHQEEREVAEPTQTAPDRKVKRWERTGKVVRINGNALHADRPTNKPIQGGFALTHNIDADFFNKWLDQNKDHPAVEGGFIFASEKPDVLDKHISRGADRLNGFEPANPTALPAEFRKIETATTGG